MSEEECSPSKLPRLESPESLPESPRPRSIKRQLFALQRQLKGIFLQTREWELEKERKRRAENCAKQIIDQLPCDGRYSSSNPLKVTILATKWGWDSSSLSLLTKELSKQLAEFRQVKVSVLVPEGSCDDGDKTVAKLFNITIVEAMKQPGSKDLLEWFYFPPESLITDVVISVGERLGKVAEIFKRFQHCKSIWFMKDQYEELNHELRDLSRALAEKKKEKPELRHRSNGDGSLYADLSVAIGQEMYKQHRQNLIPAYLAARGPGALAAYRRALKTGKTYDRRIKIMLIGQDRSGKTSLRRYLRGETFNEQEPSTDGIEMIPSIKNAGTGAWKNPADLETTSAFHHKFAEVVTQEISSSYKNSTQQFVEEGKEPQEVTQETSSDLLTRETSELVASESIETYNPRHLENISKKDIEFQRNTGAQDAKKEQKLEEIPEKVLFLVERGLEGNDTSKTEEMWPVVWDFAGQAVYHAIHPIFLSQEDVYVLVSDLTQQLSAPAQCRVTTHSNDEVVVESPHDEDTNLDHMMRWLDLVHSLVKKKSESSKDILPSNAPVALLPPVVLVGTHADGVTNPREKMDFLFKTICEKASHATGKHISQESFFIDNSNPNREDDPQIVSLRKKLLDLSKRMPHINNEIPLQWLRVEEKIHQMVIDNQVRYVRKKSFKEDIAEGICQFNNTDDVEELLHFLQARGSVIYQDHPENPDAGLVVLDPQWLMRVLSEIITVSPPWKNDPSIQKDYQFLERRGLLSQQLLDRAFENLKLEDIRDSLIHIMKKFVVICDSKNCNGEEYPYFVPCMLRLPLKNTKGTKVQNGPLPVFLKFNTKYVPSGLFCRLGVLFWDWTSKLYPHCKAPAFYANAARFQVSKDYHLTLKCHRTVIKLAIWTTCDSDSKEEQNLCEELLSHLERCKFELSDTCHWLRSVTWELCVQCPLCEPCPDESRVGTGICLWHGQNDCRHDDCGHYLLLRSLDHGASCEYCVDDVPSLSAEKLKPWTQALESFKCKERNGKRKREMSPDCSNKRPKQPEGTYVDMADYC